MPDRSGFQAETLAGARGRILTVLEDARFGFLDAADGADALEKLSVSRVCLKTLLKLGDGLVVSSVLEMVIAEPERSG